LKGAPAAKAVKSALYPYHLMGFTISSKYCISTYKSHKLTLQVTGVEVVEMVEIFVVYLVKDSYKQADDDKWYCFATITVFYRNKCSARLSFVVIKDHVTRLRLIFKQELCKLDGTTGKKYYETI
jgi:hypothetical protein